MKGVENDLARLEQLLRKLELEYDQFFSGKNRVEPQRTDAELQQVIKIYSGRAIQNPALRFRYANSVARYNSFRNVWTRKVREMEEGRVFGRPQRVGTPPPRPPVRAAAVGRKFVAGDLYNESENMEDIFNSYKNLREECGEATERLRLENFTRILADKVGKMKESQKCERVEIRLSREKDKTRIIVRPFRDTAAPK